jgi:hypothetical protein
MNIEDDLMLDKEIHERMYAMMEWLERIQPIKLHDSNPDLTVDLTSEEEMMITKLFRIDDEIVHEDQTSRSILKDLRKRIKYYENRLTVDQRLKDTSN